MQYFIIVLLSSIYIKRCVSESVSQCVPFCLSPGDKQFVCPPGTNIFIYTEGGTNKLFVPGGQTFLTHTVLSQFMHTDPGGGTNIFVSQVNVGPLLLGVFVAQW